MNPRLIKVADEEARQWKAFNFLFSVLGLRGLPVADLCHPLWNDYKRSISKVGLMGAMLKATATTNFGHRPFLSGKRFITIRQCAERLMSWATDQYMAALAERVAFDRALNFSAP